MHKTAPFLRYSNTEGLDKPAEINLVGPQVHYNSQQAITK